MQPGLFGEKLADRGDGNTFKLFKIKEVVIPRNNDIGPAVYRQGQKDIVRGIILDNLNLRSDFYKFADLGKVTDDGFNLLGLESKLVVGESSNQLIYRIVGN